MSNRNATFVCVPCQTTDRFVGGSLVCRICRGPMAIFPNMRCALPSKADRWWIRPETLEWFKACIEGKPATFPWPRDRRKNRRAEQRQIQHEERQLRNRVRHQAEREGLTGRDLFREEFRAVLKARASRKH